MQLEKRRAAGLAEIRRVRREREIAFSSEPDGPRCQDCRFGPVRAKDPDKCEHFVHWHITPDRRLRIPTTTEQARSKDGLCGPEGLLFEPYKRWRRVPRLLARMDPEAAVWAVFMAAIGSVTVLAALFI